MKKNQKILNREKTALLIVDIQEKIVPVMMNKEMLIDNNLKLIRGAKILNLPIFYTEQYPKGLGETIAELKTELEDIPSIRKMTFSCYGAADLFVQLQNKNIDQVVVTGIESHVCVMQTVLDLSANGFQVNLPADAVSSRKQIDYTNALERMRWNGIEVTTTESVLFELLNVCGTDEFKQISKLVK